MKKFIKISAVILTAVLLACITGCNTDAGGSPAPKIIEMVSIPGKSYQAAKTETTYEQWKTVYDWAVLNGYTFANLGAEGSMGKDGEDPTENKNHPVTKISWRDAVIWCNALSEMEGLTPYYYKEGTTDFSDEGNVIRVCAPGAKGSETSKGTNPNKLETVSDGDDLAEKAELNPNSNGYRLPTKDEWRYVAKGGETYNYSGSAEADEVAWYSENSDNSTHPVAQKSPNNYGIFDMTGNVSEWCWDLANPDWTTRNTLGGTYSSNKDYIGIGAGGNNGPSYYYKNLGFRVFLNGYLGDKLPSEAKEVGDIVFADGSAIQYSSSLKLLDVQKKNAVAIIYYKGTECSNDGRERTLGLGLVPYHASARALVKEKAQFYDKQLSDIAVEYSGSIGNLKYSGDKEGKDNLAAIGKYLSETEGLSDDTNVLDNYPAFEYAINYKKYATNVGVYSEDWYLPSANELYKLIPYVNTVVQISQEYELNILGETGGYCWTSSQEKGNNRIICIYIATSTTDSSHGGQDLRSMTNSGPAVLPIREF